METGNGRRETATRADGMAESSTRGERRSGEECRGFGRVSRIPVVPFGRVWLRMFQSGLGTDLALFLGRGSRLWRGCGKGVEAGLKEVDYAADGGEEGGEGGGGRGGGRGGSDRERREGRGESRHSWCVRNTSV